MWLSYVLVCANMGFMPTLVERRVCTLPRPAAPLPALRRKLDISINLSAAARSLLGSRASPSPWLLPLVVGFVLLLLSRPGRQDCAVLTRGGSSDLRRRWQRATYTCWGTSSATQTGCGDDTITHT